MDDLLKLVRTFRFTTTLSEKQDLAEKIIRHVAPSLYVRIYASVPTDTAQDVFQETLRAVATSLKNFKGDTLKEFWAWCYRIADNKTADQFRKQGSDRIFPMDPDDLLQMVERDGQDAPLINADTKHPWRCRREWNAKQVKFLNDYFGDFFLQVACLLADYASKASDRELNEAIWNKPLFSGAFDAVSKLFDFPKLEDMEVALDEQVKAGKAIVRIKSGGAISIGAYVATAFLLSEFLTEICPYFIRSFDDDGAMRELSFYALSIKDDAKTHCRIIRRLCNTQKDFLLAIGAASEVLRAQSNLYEAMRSRLFKLEDALEA